MEEKCWKNIAIYKKLNYNTSDYTDEKEKIMSEVNNKFNSNSNDDPNLNDQNNNGNFNNQNDNNDINNQNFNNQNDNNDINNQNFSNQNDNNQINKSNYNGQMFNENYKGNGNYTNSNEQGNYENYNNQINGPYENTLINNDNYGEQINNYNNEKNNTYYNGQVNNSNYFGQINNQNYNEYGYQNNIQNDSQNNIQNSSNYSKLSNLYKQQNFNNNPNSSFSSSNFTNGIQFEEKNKQNEEKVKTENKNIFIGLMIIIIFLVFLIVGIIIYKEIEINRQEQENAKMRNQLENSGTTQTFQVGTDVSSQVKVDSQTVYNSIDDVLNNKVPNTIVRGVYLDTNTTNNQSTLVAEELGWEVLKDNGDTVDLIAIKNTKLKINLWKSSGYNNGVKALNEICNSLYGNATVNGSKAISARSVNYEDFYSDTRTFEEYSYTTNNKYPIMLDSDNKDYRTGWSNQNTYFTQPQNEQSIAAEGNLTVKSNYYEGTTNKNTNLALTGEQYWLASRCVYAGVDACNFGLRTINEFGNIFYWPTFSSDGRVASPSLPIRPVITVSKQYLKTNS